MTSKHIAIILFCLILALVLALSAECVLTIVKPVVEETVASGEIDQKMSSFDDDLPSLTDEMINWVVQCESGGDNNAVGSQGEIGILQFKPKTWKFLSEKFNFEGDIHNPDDQKQFFLMAVLKGYGHYWTCWRRWIVRH